MEVSVRIIGFILRILYLVTWPLYWVRARWRPHRPLPSPSPLLLKSVKEYMDDIKSGKLSSKELTTACVDRVREVEPYINAVTEDRFQLALEEASCADQEIREANKNGTLSELLKKKPLLGIPFTVKESCRLSGMTCSVGHMDNRGQRATTDGAVVQLLKQAGGIPLLVSNVPELCLSWETTNLLHGTTNNPYCLNRTPGGSSGGEAALVGSAASPFSLASDVAGSIRVPAAFCGLFGHKPTPGIIPIDGHVPTVEDEKFKNFLTCGPIARTAEDLYVLTNIMAGKNRHKLNLDLPVDMKNVKVYFMTEIGYSAAVLGVASCIKDAIRAAAGYLRDECGATLCEEKFKGLEDSVDISVSQFFSMRNMPDLLKDPDRPEDDKSLLIEIIKSYFGVGSRSLHGLVFAVLQKTKLFIPDEKIPHYAAKAEELLQDFKNTLGNNGVFLYPVHVDQAGYHSQVFFLASGISYTMPFNILGMPATAVPMGMHRGLPVAIQVIAAPGQDRLCLAVAKQLEIGFGGWRPPC